MQKLHMDNNETCWDQAIVTGPEKFLTMPWRNGLGYTTELLKENLPDSNEFAWRLSIADVTTDGVFSNFSGYDRTLILLEGNGISLSCDGVDKYDLKNRLQSAEFKGEDLIIASLHNGPIRGFNIMASRLHCSVDVKSCASRNEMQIDISCDELLIFAVDSDAIIKTANTARTTLPNQHLLRVTNLCKQTTQLTGRNLIVVQITQRAAI